MLRISRHALLILLLGILLLPQLAAAAPQAAPANPSTLGNDTMLVRLKNGLTVYIIRDSRFPLVCTRLYVGTGSANETAEQAGISHVLEHMVFKGTEKRPKGQVARDVESLGGYLNAATSFDKTWYITDMPARHWKTGMDVVKDMAFHPSLDPAELEAEKDVIVSELKGGDDTPTRRLFEDLQVAGLAHTVYGRPIIGFEKTIRAVTADDLRAYIRTWYQPQNMMLLVAGDIDPKAVLAHAEELFGDLKNDTILPEPAPVQLEGAAGGPRVEVTYGPWNKVYLGIALPAPALGDQRSIDLDVLAYALGGDGTSQFYRKYRYEKQLVDSISVGNMSLNRAGLFYMVAQLDADKVEPFWQEFTRDLAALDAGKITPDVIERARFNYEDGMDRASETLDGLTSWKATVQFELGGPQGAFCGARRGPRAPASGPGSLAAPRPGARARAGARKGQAARSGCHFAAQLARACRGAAKGRCCRGKGGQARDRRSGAGPYRDPAAGPHHPLCLAGDPAPRRQCAAQACRPGPGPAHGRHPDRRLRHA